MVPGSCDAQAFAAQLQLYMHRSPPTTEAPLQQQPQDGGSCSSAHGSTAAAQNAKRLAAKHAALAARLQTLRAPTARHAAQDSSCRMSSASNTIAAQLQQQIRAALAQCWQVTYPSGLDSVSSLHCGIHRPVIDAMRCSPVCDRQRLQTLSASIFSHQEQCYTCVCHLMQSLEAATTTCLAVSSAGKHQQQAQQDTAQAAAALAALHALVAA